MKNAAPVQYQIIQMQGGLDLVTPTLSLRAGVLRESLNFEVSVTGGYTRIAGYERFDGRPSPSGAAYSGIVLTSVAGVTVGDTINNSPGSASGIVIAINGNAVYYSKTVGVFDLGDTIKVGTSVIGTVLPSTQMLTPAQAAAYTALAANLFRADIQPVPGTGPVRGVAFYKGTVYAWRDNGPQLGMWKSSSTGWQEVTFGRELGFNAGTAPLLDGDNITGATSGATGVVARVVLQSGAFTTGNPGVGRLILSSTTGTFVPGEALQVGGTSKATATTAATQITFAPGGRVQTDVANFGGTSGNTKLYGCDGRNRGWEFDGTTMVPIVTGMLLDIPTNVVVHRNYLFFTFGASLQFSGLGAPYSWAPLLGAGEVVAESAITNIIALPGNQQSGALLVLTDSTTHVLYGSSTLNYQFTLFNTGTGAKQFTAQNLEQTYFLDTKGVTSMATTLNYGNFDANTLTFSIRPFIQGHRNNASASGLNREKSQYRTFYSDGYALYTTIVNGKNMGSMPVYFPDPVLVWSGATSASSSEISYFGSNSGYIFQMDTGNSFDGQPIEYRFVTVYNANGGPRIVKRFRKASLEVTGTGFAQFGFNHSLAYGDTTQRDLGAGAQYQTNFQTPFWDQFTWDNFTWDGSTLSPTETELNGSGENISVTVSGLSDAYPSFTVNSIILHFSPRRGLR